MSISDDQYRQALEKTLKDAFEQSKLKTEKYLNQIMPSDKLNEKGIRIDSKSDFAKGYSIAVFYMASNMGTSIFPPHISTLKDPKQEEYAMKLIEYFDIFH